MVFVGVKPPILKPKPDIEKPNFHDICPVNKVQEFCRFGKGCEWECKIREIGKINYPNPDPFDDNQTCICYNPGCEKGFVLFLGRSVEGCEH